MHEASVAILHCSATMVTLGFMLGTLSISHGNEDKLLDSQQLEFETNLSNTFSSGTSLSNRERALVLPIPLSPN